jgi:ABC-type phosphate/phosphonate transport system substrate-binding protein
MPLSPICLAVLSLLLSPAAAHAQANQKPIDFIAVEPNNLPQKADVELRDFLSHATGLIFQRAGFDAYEKEIHAVAHRHDGTPYVARMTPYAYVVAELTGADFDIVATYRSQRNTYTYHSYFVVRPEYADFAFSAEPTLQEVADFLSKAPSSKPSRAPALPRLFIYHDEFSASSYFVPSVFFRRQHIFNVPEAQRGPAVFPILAQQFGSSSSQLIREVAEGRADIAAVWDAPKDDVSADIKDKVKFVRLDDVLPNDLLVVSKWLDPDTKKKIQDKINEMSCNTPQFSGDYVCWQPIAKASEAQAALEDLKRKAIAPPTPVTVQIPIPDDLDRREKEHPGYRQKFETYVRAAKEAIRFAGTEFVVHDSYATTRPDVIWTIDIVHDGALHLTSKVTDEEDIAAVESSISFADIADLEKHIGSFLITRMPRFRYVWGYKKEVPTVLRDIAFTPAADATIQRITWQDPEGHLFNIGSSIKARVTKADALKFELDVPNEKLPLDPMSNTAYRVILVPPVVESPALQYMTFALVLLLVLAAAAAVYDFTRSRRPAEAGLLIPAVATERHTGAIPLPEPDSATRLPIQRPTPSRPRTGSKRPLPPQQ